MRKSRQIWTCAFFCVISHQAVKRDVYTVYTKKEKRRSKLQEGFDVNQKQTGNKMAVMDVKKLIFNMGLPVILSMMMQAAYNIVDSIFVSNMHGNGEGALNALTLAFPVQMLMVAIGIGTGVGTNALLSKSLGQGDKEKVNKVSGNALFLGCIIYAVFLLFGIFGVKVYVSSQTQNAEIMGMAIRYLRICCTLSMGITFFNILEKLLQATGRTHLSTIAQITGAVTNIILDPILIFGWFGLPELGVDGAALATVIGQIASAVLGFIFHFKYNKEIKNEIRYMKPSGRVIKEIYAIGFPAIVAQALMSIMTYSLNVILVGVSENAVTAYGLYYKIQQFILFAAFGLRDVITPIVSFNYGRGDKKRVKEGIRYGMIDTLGIMLVGLILLEILASPFTAIFGLSGETQSMCISAMRVISLSFLFAGANVAFQGIFQALDGGLESLIISLCRQCLFVLPLAYGFSLIARADISKLWLVWLTFFIAEGLTMLIACGLMRRISVNKIEKMEG